MANQWQQNWDFEFTEEALAEEIAQAEAEAALAEDGPRARACNTTESGTSWKFSYKMGQFLPFRPI